MVLKIIIGVILGLTILVFSIAALLAERTDEDLFELEKEFEAERRRLDSDKPEVEPEAV